MVTVDTRPPSQSALRVAMLRAAHQLLDEPIILDDPFALQVLGDHISAAVREDRYTFNDPIMRTMRAAVIARSRYAEDMLHAAYARGTRQYVLVGAGLDTFALRNPYPDLRVYEMDLVDTQQWKTDNLRERPRATDYVSCNVNTESLLDALDRTSFDRTEPALFSWLGVTPYVEETSIRGVLRDVSRLAQGTVIVFDYRVATEALSPLEQAIEAHAAEIFRQMGEPWVASFTPERLQLLLRDCGLTSVEDLGTGEINARYYARRKDGLQSSGGGFRMTCASV
ncbi:class I SAM-dependent methyltransferase [Paraburkholderia dioscoreae]|uniref:S-adenosyl-L-methionine-dependent methyltransferase n=1 Tax=Paraburkholderia dioscoreae TaxID=2604047 RepID=A0A5Q4YWS2_9BURK|nr:SAM-dependent methyltransferase [Paraburkholderia dioscoreae]VVD31072.1 S-adenosyl-L-methionine-dependent methyltransferase [Paraburkholderia dioscoreae]